MSSITVPARRFYSTLQAVKQYVEVGAGSLPATRNVLFEIRDSGVTLTASNRYVILAGHVGTEDRGKMDGYSHGYQRPAPDWVSGTALDTELLEPDNVAELCAALKAMGASRKTFRGTVTLDLSEGGMTVSVSPDSDENTGELVLPVSDTPSRHYRGMIAQTAPDADATVAGINFPLVGGDRNLSAVIPMELRDKQDRFPLAPSETCDLDLYGCISALRPGPLWK